MGLLEMSLNLTRRPASQSIIFVPGVPSEAELRPQIQITALDSTVTRKHRQAGAGFERQSQ
jgi:hypothetical protein